VPKPHKEKRKSKIKKKQSHTSFYTYVATQSIKTRRSREEREEYKNKIKKETIKMERLVQIETCISSPE